MPVSRLLLIAISLLLSASVDCYLVYSRLCAGQLGHVSIYMCTAVCGWRPRQLSNYSYAGQGRAKVSSPIDLRTAIYGYIRAAVYGSSWWPDIHWYFPGLGIPGYIPVVVHHA